ncbi:MAG: cation:proton antiporter [Propionibacteriaceae bacterium]|jgi:CPA1 family monovalent cation:H+ antiporter|nr:cation:proton antiporter [Propionibacteriaceae bacterium]
MDFTEFAHELLGNNLIAGFLAAFAIAACAGLAKRLSIPSPLLLVALGVAVSFFLGGDAPEFPPALILQGVLPPLLYSAAVSMPAMDFRRDFTAISGLSVVLVALTAVVVGLGLHWLLGLAGLEVPIAICIAVGAILSPTDAVAVGIVERLGSPHRLVTILEGEALINDATALAVMTTALAAGGVVSETEVPGFLADNLPWLTPGATVTAPWIAERFAWLVVTAVVVGAVVGRLGLWISSKVREPALGILVTFLISFAAYIPAEHLGGSGLVAAVVAGLINGQGGPKHVSAANRIAQGHTWETVEFLLEGAVFLIMGLQVKHLIDVRDQRASGLAIVGVALGAGLMVLLVRLIFVAPLVELLQAKAKRLAKKQQKAMQAAAAGFGRQARVAQLHAELAARRAGGGGVTREAGSVGSAGSGGSAGSAGTAGQATRALRRVRRLVGDVDYLAARPFGWREGSVLVWAGMRGVVTLAGAQALPETLWEDGPALPFRASLILVAFIVAATSLIVQAGTLPMLLRWAHLTGHDPVAEAVARDKLQRRLARAARTYLLDPDLRRSTGEPFGDQAVATVFDVLSVTPTAPADEADEALTRSEAVELTEEQLAHRADQAEMWELRLGAVRAMRMALLAARSEGTYDSELLKEALEELDADEISIELRHDDGAASPG